MGSGGYQQKNKRRKISLAEKSGIVAMLLAMALALVSLRLALIPLALFLLLCLGAPFFPQFSLFLPIISRGRPGTKGVALTFDDGPCPESTPVLLDLLDRYNLSATFFIVGKQVEKYPELLQQILARGHSIGNHSLRHDNLLMLRGSKALGKDIRTTQEIIQKFTVQSLVFRPPVGITNPHLGRVLAEEGLITIGYSCRALDRGNRNISNLSRKILEKLNPGDIIMLHDLPPYQKKMTSRWKEELEHLFGALQSDYTVISLENLIGHPVMRRTGLRVTEKK
ncbi:MAG TPA: polysaccharide deacetylase family protein [Desulfobulbaceae bacterium]|nr:polysaccharide deacetylase family protein [Desulfobulbaceae bacterium]